MIGLCCNETYDVITKYNYRDDDGENDENKGRNDNDNAAYGSSPNVLIFDPITMPRSCVVGLVDDSNVSVDVVCYVSTCRTICLPYEDYIKYVP